MRCISDEKSAILRLLWACTCASFVLFLRIEYLDAATTDRTRPDSVATGFCPYGCRCSRDGKTVNCSDAELDRVPIIPESAKKLILDDNRISTLDSDSFGSTFGIEILSVRRNNISVIEARAFFGLVNLRFLYLDSNQLSSLSPFLFQNATNLQLLSLDSNPISGHDEETWQFLERLGPSLKQLDLSRTQVASGNRLPQAFASLSSLEELVMQNVNFANMTEDFFQAMTGSNVRNLDLSMSIIKNAEENALTPLENLCSLCLANVMADSKSLGNLLVGLGNGSSLEKIDMQGVFVNDEYPLAVDLFHGLAESKVRELNFAGNYAGLRGRIPAKFLHPLKYLRKLHLDDCDLTSVQKESFHGLHDLKVLTLRRNLLSCVRVSDCLFLSPEHPMRHLETLDLSDNRISEAERTVHFDGNSFPALLTLNVRKNRLTVVPFGMFSSLDKLATLDLSENPLEDLEPEAFSTLQSLHRLDLAGCRQLTHIRQDTFKGLSQLRFLNIENAGLVQIHHSGLNHLNHLEELYLRNNRLGESKDAIARVILRKSELRTLDIGENGLSTFPRGLIINGNHLKRLLLDGNRLTDCTPLSSMADGLAKLEVLDLSFNDLVEPDKTCFQRLASLKTVDISVNPFYCSCKTRDFSDWLLTTSGISVIADTESKCSAPNDLAGRSIFETGLGNFECHWKYGVVFGVFICLTVSSTLLAVVLCVRIGRMQRGGEDRRGGGGGRRATCNGFSGGCSANVSNHGSAAGTCAIFTKSGSSTPYAHLEEEELGGIGGAACARGEIGDGEEHTANGKYPSSSSFRTAEESADCEALVRQVPLAAFDSRKQSRCNGFEEGGGGGGGGGKGRSSRKQARSEDAALQTRALVHDAAYMPCGDGDRYDEAASLSPYVSSNGNCNNNNVSGDRSSSRGRCRLSQTESGVDVRIEQLEDAV